MFSRLSLRVRLLVASMTLMVVPLLIICGVTVTKQLEMQAVAAEECRALTSDDLDHMVTGIRAMCEAQQSVLQDGVKNGLAVVRHVMASEGPVSFDEAGVAWTAVDQYTKASTRVMLPRMQVGDRWLGQVRDAAAASPIVDEVQALVGGTATIFQRMNARGDMLRVCTNVLKADGSRAIGTYIPAVNPDGRPNPVIASVLAGKTYTGRAFVVDRWYITAYEPLEDADGEIVGISYFGVPMESAEALRRSIMETQIGQTGYVYVLDSEGNYVISKDGRRDGENIWDARDANGTAFIEEIIAKAKRLGPGEVATQWYPWRNEGETEARMKIAHVAYFEPWDWVIGAGSYEEEFLAAERSVADLSRETLVAIIGTALATLVLAAIIWAVIASRMSGQITAVADHLGRTSSQVNHSASEIQATSQQLAEGANDQAASLEEIAASLQEMSSVTQETAAGARSADRESAEADDAASRGVTAMEQMSLAISQIKDSSDETARILKTIDEIAFQTNLLALNAAVEAARAGDAGKGFAVVAEEVRNLANRSAEAARSTAALIESSQQSATGGVEAAEQVSGILRDITGSVERVKNQVGQVAKASAEQADGIGEINAAVSRLDQVTQTNAASAEESASASQDLEHRAGELRTAVGELRTITSGRSRSARATEAPSAPAAGPAPQERASVRGVKPPESRTPSTQSPQSPPASSPRPEAQSPQTVLPLEDDELIDL